MKTITESPLYGGGWLERNVTRFTVWIGRKIINVLSPLWQKISATYWSQQFGRRVEVLSNTSRGNWALTLVPLVAFVLMFVVIMLLGAVVDPFITHGLLVIWSLAGVVLTGYIFVRVYRVHWVMKWPGTIPFWIGTAFLVASVWHTTAIAIPLLVIAAVAVTLRAIYLVMEASKHRYR